jgi:hypothetical protein
MITAGDVEFHTPDPVPDDWAETYFFDLFVPEAGLHGWVYLVARPAAGAVVCDVEFVDRISPRPFDARYIDLQHHIPIPDRWSAFRLPNGLSFAAASPTRYRIDYVGVDDTEIHVDVTGLMQPYDIHDPAIDPMAKERPADQVAHTGFGSAYANHFDLTVRSVGTVRVRGEEHPVDCVGTMDHSWGPRPERGMSQMSYVNAHFEDGSVVQTIWAFERDRPAGEQHVFTHGYAIEGGTVHGGIAGRLTVERDDLLATSLDLRMTDVRGIEHRIAGTPVNNHVWTPYGCCPTGMAMLDWRTEDGRRGVGTSMESNPLDKITGPYMRRALAGTGVRP